MPKTLNNSTRCSCCSRLMARKSGKRMSCSRRCEFLSQEAARLLQKAKKKPWLVT